MKERRKDATLYSIGNRWLSMLPRYFFQQMRMEKTECRQNIMQRYHLLSADYAGPVLNFSYNF